MQKKILSFYLRYTFFLCDAKRKIFWLIFFSSMNFFFRYDVWERILNPLFRLHIRNVIFNGEKLLKKKIILICPQHNPRIFFCFFFSSIKMKREFCAFKSFYNIDRNEYKNKINFLLPAGTEVRSFAFYFYFLLFFLFFGYWFLDGFCMYIFS